MLGEKKPKGRIKRRSVVSVVVVAVVSIGWVATEGFLGEREEILAVGIPQHQQAAWTEFLGERGILHRFDSRSREFYVYQDPIPILEGALASGELGLSVKRALLERELEKEFRARWEHVVDPRICLAFPDPEMGETDDGEAVCIVYAESLYGEHLEEVKALLSERVEGLLAKNVVIIGTSWRPWPGYRTGTRGIMVARKSGGEIEK
jgi:hypothetical protein